MGVVQLLGLAVIVHGLPAAVHKGDAAPAAMQTDCVAISINVNDYWCQTMCPTGQCPEDMCKCGADAAALAASPAPGAPITQAAQAEAKSASFAARDLTEDIGDVPLVIVGEDDACKSLSDSASDEWCTSTCKNNKANCPTMCECDDDNMQVVDVDPLQAAQTAADKAAADAVAGVVPATAGVPAVPVAAAPPTTATVPGDFSKCKSLTLAATDEWCVHSCETGNCPETICNCDGKVPSPEPVVVAAPAPVAVPAVPAVPAPVAAVPAPVAAEPVAAPADVPAPVAVPVPEVSPVAAPVQAPAPVAVPAPAVPAVPATAAVPVPAVPAVPAAAAAAPAIDTSNCKAVSNSATDDWCSLTCGSGSCPETLCECGAAPSLSK